MEITGTLFNAIFSQEEEWRERGVRQREKEGDRENEAKVLNHH